MNITPWPMKQSSPERHQFTDKRVGLHPRTTADDNALLDLHEGADEAIVADRAFIEVHGLDDGHVRAEQDITDLTLEDLVGEQTSIPQEIG